MDLTLTRINYRLDGIFGKITRDDTGSQLCVSLEHSLDCLAAVAKGKYVCRRRLSPEFGYDVFQIIDVPGHTYIEIHIGCFNADSKGCVLVGESIVKTGPAWMIINSSNTFDKFMLLQSDCDEFNLTVR